MDTTIQDKRGWLHVALLLLAVAAAYFRVFHAGFITWDDNEYVVHNNDITGITANNISAWFSHFYIGNYHPLTLFSYAVDYLMAGTSPLVYHLTNVLLHACNAIFIYMLINRLQPNKWVGFFVALIFAVDPIHTESVSWVAERKTVLCAFFYFLALVRYTYYSDRSSVKNIIIVTLLGIAAMLSKAVAVALPLSLVAIDIWMGRDIKQLKLWLEKLPLFVIGLVLGLVAIKAQEAGKFLNLHTENNWWTTIVYAGYAYVQYIIHFIVPYPLSVIYPYPQAVGVLHYIFLILALGIITLGVLAYRKRWNVLCGGIFFYTVNIALVLQFVQFGEFLMADRYLYIACVGIIFPGVYYLFRWLGNTSVLLPSFISGIVGLMLLASTFFRNDIWLSDFNFFTAILDAFPNSAVAQYSVGGLYMRMGNYPEAEQHINLAVALDPGNYKAWYDKGALYLREGKPSESLDALNRCLAIKEYTKAYFSRALLYQGTGQPALALADVEKVLADQPDNARAYYIKADCLEQQGDVSDAMDNYNRAVQYDGKEPLFYIRRGLLYAKTHRDGPALSDLNTAVALNPDNGEALYFRGIVRYHAGQQACDDFRAALAHGYKKAQDALAQLCGH